MGRHFCSSFPAGASKYDGLRERILGEAEAGGGMEGEDFRWAAHYAAALAGLAEAGGRVGRVVLYENLVDPAAADGEWEAFFRAAGVEDPEAALKARWFSKILFVTQIVITGKLVQTFAACGVFIRVYRGGVRRGVFPHARHKTGQFYYHLPAPLGNIVL